MIIICHQFVNSIRELRVMGSVIWKMINVFVVGILIKWTRNSAVKCVLIFVKMCRLRFYLVTFLACVSIVMDLTDNFNFIRFRLTLLGLGFVHFSACLLLWLRWINDWSHILIILLWQIYFSSKYVMVIQKHQNEQVIKTKKLRRIEFESWTS